MTRWLTADRYRLALIVLAVAYCALFTHEAWQLHAGMRTHRSDLGQIDQAVWNSSRGRLLQQTDNGFVATRLTDHVEPILVLISPVFWLWDDVRALLLLQALAAALGVLPLYALALRLLAPTTGEAGASGNTAVPGSPPASSQFAFLRADPAAEVQPLAFALGVAYLLAPQLQSALLTEFHAAPLAVPLILWALWAVDARRWGQFAAAALLTALVKEEMALLAAGLGAWAIWQAWYEQFNAKAQRGKDAEEKAAEKPAQNRAARAASSFALRLCLFAPLRCEFPGIAAGLLVLVLGLGWFALATFVIVPAYAAPLYGTAESTYFARYGSLGDSAADIFKSFFTQPQAVLQIASEPPRVAYLLGLLAAFGGLSLLAPEVLLLSLPLLLANLLSAYPAQYYGEFHYSAPLVGYFAAAAAYGLGRLWRPLARRMAGDSAAFQHLPAAGGGMMALAALLQNRRTALRPLLLWALVIWLLAWSGGNYLLHGRGPLGGRHDRVVVTPHHRLLAQFTAQIPPDAAVTATAGVHPHVSHRQYVYQFPLGLDRAKTPVPAEWALLDVTTNTDMAPGDLKAQVDRLLAADWGVVDAADGFLLLRRGEDEKTIPPAFYSFARSPDTNTGAAGADTPGGMPLRALMVAADDWQRWRQTKITLDWAVGTAYDPSRDAPWLEVVSPGGAVVAALPTAAPPALVWYPPDQWQPADLVHVTTLPLALPSRFGIRAAGGGETPQGIYVRQPNGYLSRLAFGPAQAADPAYLADLGAALAPYLQLAPAGPAVQAQLADGRTLRVQGFLPVSVGARQPLDILLQWQLPAGAANWPPELAAFVHVRDGAGTDAATVAQADGPPQWFGRPSPAFAPAPAGDAALLNDWRQVTLDASCVACQVVIGVYDPATGARLPLLDADGAPIGDEWVVGTVTVGPPLVPDQACALTGACE